MIVVKSILVGFVSALALAAIWILLVVVIPFALQIYAVTHEGGQMTGSGGLSAVSSTFSDWSVIGMALLGFAGGFYWEFQKSSRTIAH